MVQSVPLVVLFSKGLSRNVVCCFLNDLARYGVTDVEEVASEASLYSLIESCPRKITCVCSAEACYNAIGRSLEERNYSNLIGLLLFCGPHEDFYAKWSSTCSAVKFLSHNLKEIRRAIIWFLAGGDFSMNGEAVPPIYSVSSNTTETSSKGKDCSPISSSSHYSVDSGQRNSNYALHAFNGSPSYGSNSDCQYLRNVGVVQKQFFNENTRNNLEKLVMLWHFSSIAQDSL